MYSADVFTGGTMPIDFCGIETTLLTKHAGDKLAFIMTNF
jgi:hypothetical protein